MVTKIMYLVLNIILILFQNTLQTIAISCTFLQV